MTVLELSALRAAATSPRRTARRHRFADLAADCAARLRRRLALPQRAAGDWSIDPASGRLHLRAVRHPRNVPRGPAATTFEWPLAKQRRQHIHGRIDNAELPVTHVTRRQGSPYTLVLTKTDALFTGEHSARETAETDLEWLTGRWNVPG